MLKVLSLGWGVQSFTLAAMSALGELEPLDLAIHSDTTWERESTYKFAEKWTPWLEAKGLKVITTSDEVAAKKPITADHNLLIPAFVKRADGENGMLRRQCTQRWKIAPMRRVLRKEMELRGVKQVEQWLGISKDEWQRARNSDVSYIESRYPLLEKKMSRLDCINWLERNGLEVPGKSSCTHCVFHNQRTWNNMKRENGPDWKQAVEFDSAIRNKSTAKGNLLFVHSARIPLDKAVTDQQSEMFKDEELACESAGYCWT